MVIHDNVLGLIGNTPMVRVQHMESGPCELFLKLEDRNPGGSIKDRIGLSMIDAAERRGLIKPGDTLVEGTAGNTGIGLALVAQQKGYRLVLVVPDKMSREKIFSLKAMGAEVVITRSDVAKGHPDYYQDMAQRLADETPGAYFINQFGNPDNPLAHEQSTGPEILRQMDGRVDAVVVGCGSSGTLAGLSAFFARESPDTQFILADPVGSILTQYINEGVLSDKSGSWMVEGIGEDFLPSISDFSRVAKAYAISDHDSFHTARELLSREGVLGGSSTGTLVAAALRWCREQDAPKRVVTLVADTGNKYLSKMYSDYWMLDNGFIEREMHGDLRDLVSRPHALHDTIFVAPTDTLAIALGRMKMYDISQLPVLQDDKLVSMIDEASLLSHLDAGGVFGDPVSAAMRPADHVLDKSAPLDDLRALLADGHVAAIMDAGQFVGLVTRMDLLNHLRRKAQ